MLTKLNTPKWHKVPLEKVWNKFMLSTKLMQGLEVLKFTYRSSHKKNKNVIIKLCSKLAVTAKLNSIH